MQRLEVSISVQDLLFQSSPPPKERCNKTSPRNVCDATLHLSILTAPEGAVQYEGVRPDDELQILSILTAPEGAVQYGALVVQLQGDFFQSSPPPKERCNLSPAVLDVVQQLFQSSPPPKERCNLLAHGAGHADVLPFNPHRPRRSGAMQGRPGRTAAAPLSILTAPEGAVQCGAGSRARPRRTWLSILTAPEGAVQ